MTKKPATETLWLLIGLGLVAAAIGGTVGVAESPVASAVIPAIFGLVITFVGLFSKNAADEKPQAPKGRPVDHRWALEARQLVGKCLIVFTVFYISGLIVGAKVRISRPLQVTRQMPWESTETAPDGTGDALLWLSVQERLLSAGYTSSQVREVYKLSLRSQLYNYGSLDSDALRIFLGQAVEPRRDYIVGSPAPEIDPTPKLKPSKRK